MFRLLLILGLLALSHPTLAQTSAQTSAQTGTQTSAQALAQTGAGDGRYVPGLEDLPLMSGLFSINAEPLRFDSPGGRIVVAYAEGRADRASIAAFYAQTLAPLGWQRLEPLFFRREAETLRIEVDDAPPSTRVRFFLAPAKP